MKKTLSAKSVTMHGFCGCMALLAACGITAVASAQTTRTLRIVTYNLEADTGTITTPRAGLVIPTSGTATNGGVLEGIGEEIINGDPAQPIDILALEETTSNSTTVQPILTALNAFYAYFANPAGYAMSPYQALSTGGTGGGPSALVYNTNTVQLLASVPVDPTNGVSNLGSVSGEYREVIRYEFAPTGVTAGTNNEFYIYVSHYKASSGSPNTTYRFKEAQLIRNDETNLAANARVLYVGDYNPDNNSSEQGYQTICSNSSPTGVKQGQGVDPLNILWGPYTSASTTINWSSTTTDPNILFMLSDASTGIKYRDDLQVMTSNVYYGVTGGLAYVPGSYHSFANNGSFTYGASVNTTANTALNDLDPALTNLYKLSATTLKAYLTTASDHLPVVADYTIPIGTIAAPSASFTAAPTNGVAPLGVTFTDTSSGSPTSWSWTFGDTGTSTSQSPSHTYTTPGTYTVALIASNAGGSSTNTKANLITALTSAPAPSASFSASPTSGAGPLSVSFTDTSSNSPTSWSWTFGDTGTSTSENPSHTYTTPRAYTVALIASNAAGSSTDTVANLINVYDPFAWWQLNYFGSTNNPNAAPAADDTGTGMSNTNKFLAGFNPANPAAYLHILSIVEQPVADNTNVVVTYLGPNGDNTYTPGIASRTNVLDYMTGDASGNYTNGGWQDTGQTNILSGGNGSGIVTNMVDTAIPAPSATRYYRVRVLLP